MFNNYPHTDLHELNLDWVIKKVKELAAAWAQVQQDWTDEQAAFANLQSWIENYFNNLDVQTEINVKIDSMVVAGTMSELIAPYVASGLPAEVADQIGDVVATQIGPVVAAQISAVVADQLPAVAAAAAAQEVSAWLALHVNPDTGYVIDDTFTIQGAAADAKAVGDEFTAIKSALTELDNIIDNIYNWEQGGIYASTGEAYTVNTRLRTGYITDLSKCVGVISGFKYSVFAYNNDDSYVGCWNGKSFDTNGTFFTTKLSLKQIGNYKYIIVLANTSDTEIRVNDSDKLINIVITDQSLSNSFKCADSKTVGDYFKTLGITKIDGLNLTWEQGTITDAGVEAGSNFYIRSNPVSVKLNTNVLFAGNIIFDSATSIVFVSEYANTTFLKRTMIYNQENGYVEHLLSSECTKVRYIIGHATASGVQVNPTLCYNFSAFNYDITTNQILTKHPYYIKNMLNKVTQLKDVKWRTLGSIYKNDGTVLTPSGRDVKGIPYSSVKEYDKYIGYNVSLRTFMTASKNPYSLLYTENVNKNVNQSAYGIDYHGTNCGCYYGNVCSSLVSYALGTPMQYDSINWQGYLLKVGETKLTETQTAEDLQLGDVIWQSGHVLFVTNIVADGNKNVVTVDLTETGGSYPVTTTLTASQFNDAMIANNRKILRYTHLFENDVYEPSEFIACDGEYLDGAYQYNDDVCTFAGDYAAFHTGEEIWINYNLGDTVYDTLYVKDASGTTIESYNLDNSNHKVSIGSSLEAGIYTAILSDGDAESEPTHFEVIDTTVSATIENNMLNIGFSSTNGTPLYFKICELDGTVMALREFSHDERLFGSCTVDIVALHNAQFDTTLAENIYLKVFFRGRYGVVRNELIQLG